MLSGSVLSSSVILLSFFIISYFFVISSFFIISYFFIISFLFSLFNRSFEMNLFNCPSFFPVSKPIPSIFGHLLNLQFSFYFLFQLFLTNFNSSFSYIIFFCFFLFTASISPYLFLLLSPFPPPGELSSAVRRKHYSFINMSPTQQIRISEKHRNRH